MVLRMLFKSADEARKKLDGRTDILEAGAALGALVAAADGTIGDDEQAATVKALRSSEMIKASFSQGQIDQAVAKEFDKADGGTRSGRLALWKEVEEVAAKGDREVGKIIVTLGLDVADLGGMEDKERAVLEKAAGLWGLRLADLEV